MFWFVTRSYFQESVKRSAAVKLGLREELAKQAESFVEVIDDLSREILELQKLNRALRNDNVMLRRANSNQISTVEETVATFEALNAQIDELKAENLELNQRCEGAANLLLHGIGVGLVELHPGGCPQCQNADIYEHESGAGMKCSECGGEFPFELERPATSGPPLAAPDNDKLEEDDSQPYVFNWGVLQDGSTACGGFL